MKGLIAVKFDDQDRKLLAKVCGERREDISGFVRRSVMGELARLGYLPDDQKKALGVTAE